MSHMLPVILWEVMLLYCKLHPIYMFTKSDLFLKKIYWCPVVSGQKEACTGIWLTWFLAFVTSQQTAHECHCMQPNLSCRTRWYDVSASQYSPVLLSLPHTPQEMAPLSLGEEVAWTRPLAHWIYGDCGKLLIVTYKWKTRTHCSTGCPLCTILQQ